MIQNIFLLNIRSIKLPIYIKIAIVFAGVIIVFFSIQSYRSTNQAIQKLNDRYHSTDSIMNKASNQDELFALLKKQGFLQSSLKQAESDSIGLCINFVDSSVALTLKGVELHGSKIIGFTSSNIFSNMDRASLITMLSGPLTITEDTSNIFKEPIKTVKAPKNEAEAAQMIPQNIPDTIQENVVIQLELDSAITVLILQEPDSVSNDQKNYDAFLSSLNRKKSMDMWKSLITFHLPEYKPWIKIYLPADEAKSLYRALPARGNVILKI